jgi:hypothetical protein
MSDYTEAVRKMKTSELLRLSRDRLALLGLIDPRDEMSTGELLPIERATAAAISDEIDRRIPIPEER